MATGGVRFPTPKKKKSGKKKKPAPTYTRPPSGSYDPALDAQRRAARRGLTDLLENLKLAGGRASEDLQTQLDRLTRQKGQGVEDIGLRRERGERDIELRRVRGEEDFTSQLQALSRRYNVQGQQQMQLANQQGVLRGGTQRAAAKKRAENEGFERAPIQTAQTRFGQDIGRERGDLLSDLDRAGQRLGTDYETDVSLSQRAFERGGYDRTLQGERATREQKLHNLDLIKQMIFQARQLKPGAFTQYGKKKK